VLLFPRHFTVTHFLNDFGKRYNPPFDPKMRRQPKHRTLILRKITVTVGIASEAFFLDRGCLVDRIGAIAAVEKLRELAKLLLGQHPPVSVSDAALSFWECDQEFAVEWKEIESAMFDSAIDLPIDPAASEIANAIAEEASDFEGRVVAPRSSDE
jgi:hypothetical protein